MENNDYKYYKFVGGRYFRVTPDEETFEVINDKNEWEEEDMIYFLYNDLGMDYERVTDPNKLKELMNLNKNYGGKQK